MYVLNLPFASTAVMVTVHLKEPCEGFTSIVTLNVSDSVKNASLLINEAALLTNPRKLSGAQELFISVEESEKEI